MLQSMTGFGRNEYLAENARFNIEIKSLNSKSLDISIRPGSFFGERELDFRNIIAKKLVRGKLDITITVERKINTTLAKLNTDIANAYFDQIRSFCVENKLEPGSDLLRFLFTLPGSISTETEVMNPNDWLGFTNAFEVSLDALLKFRNQEGLELARDIQEKVQWIESHSNSVKVLVPLRIDKIRNRLNNSLASLADSIKPDQNRLEQELIYYIEKLDVNEELVRLGNHLSYFVEVMENEEQSGRKLGFIAQEIGREINTLGSKANDSGIQQLVVAMKDELEKIKEQLLNVL